ncbi:FtsB family cell division protein [Bacillus sp. PS06]|uniref:FtsB family cell division protein n=1 Tax=Bacillus sp. PS06 TaxID=2764176 RepID=UPI00178747FC|nr:septum formation initiator family protein [Bacillus sp. PS06]MBD8071006.1 septum formation initiator family protein [Bacillus sp. PS06]
MSAAKKGNLAQLQSTYINAHNKQEEAIARKRRGLYRRLIAFTVLGLLITYGFVSTLISQYNKIQEQAQTRIELEQEATELKKQQVLLEEEIVKLDDDDYIAKIARRDYFLSEEGEIIFKISGSSSSY